MEATDKPLTSVVIGGRRYVARTVSHQTIGSDVITTIVERSGHIRQFVNERDLVSSDYAAAFFAGKDL